MALMAAALPDTARFRAYGPRQLGNIAVRYGVPAEAQHTVKLLSQVLPFRVNEYVLSELIDWRRIPEDPIYQMVFPQPGMLAIDDVRRLDRLAREEAPRQAVAGAVREIRGHLNPHPSGQKEFNVPRLDGEALAGLQHKYRETVLYFPGQGQSCHAYCTYCFRWAQFVGEPELRFAAPGPERLVAYLRRHPEVTDVLVTGGDPMVMSTELLRTHLEPLLAVDTVRTIRIGTKSIAYWPYRYLTDRDADDAMRLFDRVVASGRHLAVMAHLTHVRELETDVARRAIARIRSTGATVYGQAPMVAHVNDDVGAWTNLWQAELALGALPYYLFVERDTGPYDYFKVSLARAVEIFHAAYRRLPGLARTVRGPVMSTIPGKVVVDGVEEDSQGRSFQMRLLQARDPAVVGRPFRARYSATAAWLSELRLDPAAPPDIVAALAGAMSHRRGEE